MTASANDFPVPSLGELLRRRETLEHRLNDGDVHIRNASRDGVDTSAWEDLWVSLLHDYEMVCRAIESQRSGLPAAA